MLNPEQQAAALTMLHGPHCFFTGPAGTGKTYTLNEYLRQTNKHTIVSASTGMAALLIGGCTFHSLFGLGIEDQFPSEIIARALKKPKVTETIGEAEVIIVDEISMLPGPTLSMASRIAQEIRGSSQPFGGIKMIFVGDFFQLPPVRLLTSKDWAFNSDIWQQMNLACLGLTQSMRAESQDFVSFLLQLRHGKAPLEYFEKLRSPQKDGTYMYSLRKQADAHNQLELNKLKTKSYTREACCSGNEYAIKSLTNSLPVPITLVLKEGALVMLRRNSDSYVNGSIGIVKAIKPHEIVVELHNGNKVYVERCVFDSIGPDGKITASIRQYPICLAWAITIHKAQGATLDSATVDLKNIWEPGQAYVAISRVRKPENLCVTGLNLKAIRCSKDVEAYYQQNNLL